jgi:hypothetical protein
MPLERVARLVTTRFHESSVKGVNLRRNVASLRGESTGDLLSWEIEVIAVAINFPEQNLPCNCEQRLAAIVQL